jgi:hypothetical protein
MVVCANLVRVALVVEAYDRDIVQCVNITTSDPTGMTVLKHSNLTIDYADTSVCSINGVGCNFPKETCFCKCQFKVNNIVEVRSGCQYWSYYHLKGASWQYSKTGPADFKVSDGDVEGWKWDLGDQKPPKIYQFKEICK